MKLNMNTKLIGKNIIYFEQIDSTQKKAKELLKENVQNGSIVISDCQTSGIGTNNRVWHTPKLKNIAMTLIIYPKCRSTDLEGLTFNIATCITKAIQELYKVKLDIKLPNDIMYNGKKIGGILTQATTIGNDLKNILIGIGINVNQEVFPDEIKNIATSLKNEFDIVFNREDIVSKICENIEKIMIESKILHIDI